MKIFGIVGWSGSGKTTLMEKLLPELVAKGFEVSTVKHTHHDIEIDKPGKDSDRHRKAGAREVLVTSPYRWALVHEHKGQEEPDLDALTKHMSDVDLLLVEGFKTYPFDKLEIFRPATGKTPVCTTDQTIVAVASDETLDGVTIPQLDLNDPVAVADFIVRHNCLEAR